MTDMQTTRAGVIGVGLVTTDHRSTRAGHIYVYSLTAPTPPVPPTPPIPTTIEPMKGYNRRPAPVLYQKGWVDHETGNLQRAIHSIEANVTTANVIFAYYTPTLINAGETFIVPANKQVLYAQTITVAGTLTVSGSLIMVN